MSNVPLLAAVLVWGCAAAAVAEEASIVVHAKEVLGPVSRHMTGACIEDVNHEIYGGLYSQMIFGESFQEPAPPAPVRGFAVHGGQWTVKGDELWAAAGDGPKLVSDLPAFSTGEVGVEILLPGNKPGNAGLIVKVRDAGVGADKFTGYEVALSSGGTLVLHRHRQNWEPIKEVPCGVPADRWVPLVVKMTEKTVEALVAGKSIIRYEDAEHPLEAGRVGLRPWQREARFRNLWVNAGGRVAKLPFETGTPSGAEGVSAMWRPLARGTAKGSFATESAGAFIGRQSQRIALTSGEGEIGIENRGLNRWGMCFREGKPYEGYLWLRADKATDVHVAMESGDGAKVYAEARVGAAAGDWKRVDFTLTPNGSDAAGRLAVKLKAPGSVLVGHAFLQPGEWGRFRGLPVRKDVAEALLAQGITVLRYGGSMVNHGEYRWKKMIGPRDRRPPYRGTWYPYSTNGWGIVDFINFCEAAGFLGVAAFNMDETPQDMADFVEYVNGAADSPWGRRRVEDGHPNPYRLKHIELGNEEAVNENYWRRFKPIAEAMWAKDPGLVLVAGDFAYGQPITDPFDVKGAAAVKTLAAHKRILEFAKAAGKTVWFDVHVWNNEPHEPDLRGTRDFAEMLGRLCPGADYKVCVFEENAGNHAVRRAIGHAHAINQLERLGRMVQIVCAANCLQPYRQNDNGWDQGMVFLTPSQVWGQPPYYVTQMVSRNYLPRCVKADIEDPAGALDVTAKTSEDGRVLQVQVVNFRDGPAAARLVLDGFAPTRPHARAIVLAGQLNDVNTPQEPERIVSKESTWRHRFEDGGATYTLAAYSFTILRFE
jgi:alpha-L-arabinofuranosidase